MEMSQLRFSGGALESSYKQEQIERDVSEDFN